MLIKGRLRTFLKAQKVRLHASMYSIFTGNVYYRVGSRDFNRENAAVFAGIKEHRRKVDAGTEIFELRRRVHMIEKGLTMKPRRDTFAVAYIDMVLERFERTLANGVLTDVMVAWIRDVLNAYFEATEKSTNAVIVRARTRYRALRPEIDHPYVGPAPVGEVRESIDIDALRSLAEGRRSVRWYAGRSVDRAIVDRAISVAIEAPTACNRVPYRFRIFDVPEDARRVADIAGGTNGYVHNLQSIAVLVGDLSAYVAERDRHLVYIDGSLAAMSFLLSLEAQGVSSLCINWPDVARPEKELAKLIGLKPYERVVMLIAFGYADPEGLAPLSPKVPLASARVFERLTDG